MVKFGYRYLNQFLFIFKVKEAEGKSDEEDSPQAKKKRTAPKQQACKDSISDLTQAGFCFCQIPFTLVKLSYLISI